MLRPKLNRIWAKDSDALRRDPGDAKYLQGWISEIPTFQVLNFLQYKVDTTILAIAERGIPEWGSDIQYGIGRIVWDDVDDSIYIAIVQKPDKDKRPSANSAHWSKSSIQITKKEFDDIAKAITNHIADKNNPHKVSAAQLNAYDKGEMDALVAQYRALVQAHVDNRDNPHGTTAEDVGAVSKSRGGVYTADVSFTKPIIMDADNTARVCQSNGLYLEVGPKSNTVAVVGLNAEGIAVAGPKNAKSPIVTESMFQDLKARFSPDYATPNPSLQLNFVNSVNVQVGSTCIQTSSDPRFDTASGAWSRPTQEGVPVCALKTDDELIPSEGDFELTMVADVLFRDCTKSEYGFIMGFSQFYLALDGLGKGNHCAFPGLETIRWTSTPTKLNRFCFTVSRKGGDVRLEAYMNGRSVGSATGTYAATLTMRQPRIWSNTPSEKGAAMNLVNNWRVWNKYLTPEQVSTL